MEKISEEIDDGSDSERDLSSSSGLSDGGVTEIISEDSPSQNLLSQNGASLEVSQELGTRAKICAVLFVSTRPVSLQTLADAAGCDVSVAEQELQELKRIIDPAEFGFGVEEVAEAWQFRSSALAAPVIARLTPPKAKRLSKAASETLAVIAYKQPVGKADIDSIRGVDSVPTLRTLLDLKLIRAVGRSNTPGHPVLYGTTNFFLERFGLRDLAELPTVRELEELEAVSQSAGEEASLSESDTFDDSRPLTEQIEVEILPKREVAVGDI